MSNKINKVALKARRTFRKDRAEMKNNKKKFREHVLKKGRKYPKCQVCGEECKNNVDILGGQETKFCSKACRLARHNKKKYGR